MREREAPHLAKQIISERKDAGMKWFCATRTSTDLALVEKVNVSILAEPERSQPNSFGGGEDRGRGLDGGQGRHKATDVAGEPGDLTRKKKKQGHVKR